MPLELKRMALVIAATMAALFGCSASYHFRAVPGIEVSDVPLPEAPMAEDGMAAAACRSLPMFAAKQRGERIVWDDLLAAARWANVVLIGEQHDDAPGHDVQLAIVEDVLHNAPRGSVALSMEMLERDDQATVDDFAADLIERDEFIERTNSAGWPDWQGNYQPIVEAAKGAGAPIIAANAPRRYVRLARTRGYDDLRRFTAAQRALFALPPRPPSERYRARFFDVMSPHEEVETAAELQRPAPGGADGSGSGPDEDTARDPRCAATTRAELDAALRSQLVWDATMGQSIARALRRRDVTRVIHLVGQFHSDFEGGTVQMIRAFSSPLFPPFVLTISLQRRDTALESMHADDVNRADVVIYTGERPPDEQVEADERQTEAKDEGDGTADERR